MSHHLAGCACNPTGGVAAGAESLDAHAMQQAANYLVGPHDFQHFCKINFGNTTTHHREVLFAEVLPYPVKWQEKGDVIVLNIRGSGFLWHQVWSRPFLGTAAYVSLVGESLSGGVRSMDQSSSVTSPTTADSRAACVLRDRHQT